MQAWRQFCAWLGAPGGLGAGQSGRLLRGPWACSTCAEAERLHGQGDMSSLRTSSGPIMPSGATVLSGATASGGPTALSGPGPLSLPATAATPGARARGLAMAAALAARAGGPTFVLDIWGAYRPSDLAHDWQSAWQRPEAVPAPTLLRSSGPLEAGAMLLALVSTLRASPRVLAKPPPFAGEHGKSRRRGARAPACVVVALGAEDLWLTGAAHRAPDVVRMVRASPMVLLGLTCACGLGPLEAAARGAFAPSKAAGPLAARAASVARFACWAEHARADEKACCVGQ